MSPSKKRCVFCRGAFGRSMPSPPAPLPQAGEGSRGCARAGEGSRRGAVAVVALVCVAVASIFMVVMVRRALGEWKMVRLEARQVQCRWLAESALDRAAARLASDPKYQGETWKIPAARLLGREQAADSESAAVKIDVTTPAGNPLQRLIRVQADWPEAAPERARVTRQATIELSPLKK